LGEAEVMSSTTFKTPSYFKDLSAKKQNEYVQGRIKEDSQQARFRKGIMNDTYQQKHIDTAKRIMKKVTKEGIGKNVKGFFKDVLKQPIENLERR